MGPTESYKIMFFTTRYYESMQKPTVIIMSNGTEHCILHNFLLLLSSQTVFWKVDLGPPQRGESGWNPLTFAPTLGFGCGQEGPRA